MTPHALRRADFKSEAWERMRAYLEARRAELREQLESDATHDESNKLRGRIAELKVLLGLEKAPATVPRTGAILSAEDLPGAMTGPDS